MASSKCGRFGRGTPDLVLSQSTAGTNGRRPPVHMGGVLRGFLFVKAWKPGKVQR